ncbi:MAG: hypothetical protein MI749_19840 [Desulfovibrionales bacterium]|nr:hypothetical protein [Desulfovibrionales bacterium]
MSKMIQTKKLYLSFFAIVAVVGCSIIDKEEKFTHLIISICKSGDYEVLISHTSDYILELHQDKTQEHFVNIIQESFPNDFENYEIESLNQIGSGYLAEIYLDHKSVFNMYFKKSGNSFKITKVELYNL